MNSQMVNQLKAAYNGIESISLENADRLEKILLKLKRSDLVSLKNAGIKWVSYKAGFILARENGRSMDFALDFVADRLAEEKMQRMVA